MKREQFDINEGIPELPALENRGTNGRITNESLKRPETVFNELIKRMSMGRFGTRILRAEEDKKTHHKTKVIVKLIEWD